MTYGTIKVDTVTFTNDGVDKSVTLSGLVQNPTFSGNVTVTGTLSGVTVTGTTASFTSGNFTNISGGTHTITSGVFAAGSAASPSITFTGDLNTGIYSPGADQVAISTGGSGRLFVDASGGISTSSTAWQGGAAYQAGGLQIGGSTYAKAILQTNGTIRSEWFFDNADTYLQARAGIFYITNTTANPIGFYTNGSERLRITSAGLVGIGTSSPSGRLTIANDSALNEIEFTGNDYTNVYSSTTQGFDIGISNGSSTGPLRLLTANTERLRITSAGNVGIGTTSPLTKLDVRSGVITAGSSSSPDGTEILRGYYSATDGALAVIGTEYSSGGIVIGSAVKPSTSASDAFLSSTTVNVARGAYTIAGNTHKWYIGAVQTVAENSSVSTSEVMRIDSSGRLLVGTSSSSAEAKFIVQGGATAAGGAINIQRNATTASAGSTIGFINFANSANNVGATISADGDGTWSAGTSHPTLLKFSTTADGASSPTERMRIDSSGRVGVGTTSPGQALSVAGNISSSAVGTNYVASSSQGVTTSYLITDTSGGNIQVDGAWPIRFTTNSNERARIDSSGRLLVGTSSARSNFYNSTLTSLFQVENASGTRLTSFTYGEVGNSGPIHVFAKHRSASVGGVTIVAADDNLGTLSFQGSDGTEFVAGAEITAQVDGTPGANDMPGRLVFSTTADGASSPTERMRISSTGKIIITAAAGVSEPAIAWENTVNSSGTFGSVSFLGSNCNNTSSYHYIANTGLADKYYIYGNGTTGTPSDINLKKNIETTRDGYLEDLCRLRVVKYNWNEQTDDEPKELGVIAQELEQVFPGLVQQGPEKEDGSSYKAVKTSVLPFMLLKALQEAVAKIEILEAKVAVLESV